MVEIAAAAVVLVVVVVVVVERREARVLLFFFLTVSVAISRSFQQRTESFPPLAPVNFSCTV